MKAKKGADVLLIKYILKGEDAHEQNINIK